MTINFKRGWRRLTIIISSTAALIGLLVSSAWIWPSIKSENANAAEWDQFQAFISHPDRFIEKSDLTADMAKKFGQEDSKQSIPFEDLVGNALRSRYKDVQLNWLNDSELGAIVVAKYPKYSDWLMNEPASQYKYAAWDEYAAMFALPPLAFAVLFGVMRIIEWLVTGFVS